MSNVICFDRVAEAKSILKTGISGTSIRGRSELKTAAWYLINKTTYTIKQIESRLRQASEEYFRGMTYKYIDESIKDVIESLKRENDELVDEDSYLPLVIYKEELEQIEKIKHDDSERLAFIFLCVSKMSPF